MNCLPTFVQFASINNFPEQHKKCQRWAINFVVSTNAGHEIKTIIYITRPQDRTSIVPHKSRQPTGGFREEPCRWETMRLQDRPTSIQHRRVEPRGESETCDAIAANANYESFKRKRMIFFFPSTH